MSGVVSGAAVIGTSAGWSGIGGWDSGGGEARGAWFVHCVVGAVGCAWTGGCGDAAVAFGAASAGVAGTACGVVDELGSALVSASAAFSRCHKLVNAAAGSVMPASGDMT